MIHDHALIYMDVSKPLAIAVSYRRRVYGNLAGSQFPV